MAKAAPHPRMPSEDSLFAAVQQDLIDRAAVAVVARIRAETAAAILYGLWIADADPRAVDARRASTTSRSWTAEPREETERPAPVSGAREATAAALP